ncbi:MAG: VapC toxin family PIN domain ribonuclease [Microbacterium sp.]|nr:MAG: VapC toxin family PIN domain ribonuclease [Microbacterium sp.]
MISYLLDANVVIALVVREHVHHDDAHTWLRGVARAAVTPVVEGELVRYLVRIGVGAASVAALLGAVRANHRIEFWPDDISYADVDLAHVVGHRQVTDAYLAASAERHGALLATFDRALADARPNQTLLIPTSRP